MGRQGLALPTMGANVADRGTPGGAVIYYQDPDGKPAYSAEPRSTPDGRPARGAGQGGTQFRGCPRRGVQHRCAEDPLLPKSHGAIGRIKGAEERLDGD